MKSNRIFLLLKEVRRLSKFFFSRQKSSLNIEGLILSSFEYDRIQPSKFPTIEFVLFEFFLFSHLPQQYNICSRYQFFYFHPSNDLLFTPHSRSTIIELKYLISGKERFNN